jgi:hypothetical protein
MSDSDYLVAGGQFVYSEGVDCKRNPEYMQLERRPVNRCTLSDMGTCMCNTIENDGNFIIGGLHGQVWYADGTLLGTVGNSTIVNISRFTITL